MTAKEIADLLEYEMSGYLQIYSVMNFEEAGIKTKDDGLVIILKNGERFNVTIKKDERSC